MTQQKIKFLEEMIQSLKRDLEVTKSKLTENSDRVNFLNGVLDQSLVGIYVIDEEKFSYTNKTFAAMFGFNSPDEIIGKFPITELVAPECRELVSEK